MLDHLSAVHDGEIHVVEVASVKMLENISEKNEIDQNIDDSHVHLSLLERQTGDGWWLWRKFKGVVQSGFAVGV